LCGNETIATPPLSLSSSPSAQKAESAQPHDVLHLLEHKAGGSQDAVRNLRAAISAAQTLRQRPRPHSISSEGVKIWSGPAADRPEPACSMMPSISESPLEQDFTIEGMPSKLGCPFASMANKKLSSHAASVLSRYNTRDSVGGVPSTPLSSVSRLHGGDSMSRRESRRASFVDPIKAEICGMSDHNGIVADEAKQAPPPVENADAGVCPIRFLDQHSPEEVATYFEKHKHELPRSHEVCVRRYQSNEEQIRQLDAKYGNLVSMIQGLGAKHKELLPDEPAEGEEDEEQLHADKKSDEKVRKWARSVSAMAEDGHEEAANHSDDVGDEARLPHFERPLRDIRVGESPSRPWGIPVPAKYLEEARSEASSKPAEISSPVPQPKADAQHEAPVKPAAKCPFGFDQAPPKPAAPPAAPKSVKETPKRARTEEQPAVIAMDEKPAVAPAAAERDAKEAPRMIFQGPVFIGYSADDAIRILRESGLRQPQ
jgi:hypothetical protein